MTEEATVRRVKTITNRLAEKALLFRPETSNWLWQVNIVDDDETVNASCMPGGKMVLYTGLLQKVAPTDDELAQVSRFLINSIANRTFNIQQIAP